MTCCAGREIAAAAWLAVLLLAAGPAAPAKRRPRSAVDLTNIFLGPALSNWLVGPIARLASDDEIDTFLALRDDRSAGSFVTEFWRRRDPDPATAANRLRELFDERAAEADRLYEEAAHRGRHTDRGTIHVLFGPPEETRYELSNRPHDPPIETWIYPKDAAAGLDGESPDRMYRFAKEGDLTIFYRKPLAPDPRRQRLLDP